MPWAASIARAKCNAIQEERIAHRAAHAKKGTKSSFDPPRAPHRPYGASLRIQGRPKQRANTRNDARKPNARTQPEPDMPHLFVRF